MAFVEPGSVLPLVLQRFREALESSTATHQLSTSITTLAMCVRPMLLAGWGLPEEPCAQVGGWVGWGGSLRPLAPACFGALPRVSCELLQAIWPHRQARGVCSSASHAAPWQRPKRAKARPSCEPTPPTPLQLLAEAMMALLPGIDANDEGKTTAVFKFYISVLASVPAMGEGEAQGEGAAFELPLYLDDWLDEVGGRSARVPCVPCASRGG
jgi:hypothetical protein